MVGIVLSDNLLLLIVFWELTSLSSFLLIGYWRHLPQARQGARMALVVTGGGGLALIGGMLILGQIAGSYQLSEVLARGDIVKASPLYVPALLLILTAAFTKSAQFPFHFWLPHAMSAPTPVSAYLHSATMVKAGVFLLARLWPVLAGTQIWFLIVAPVGLATMLIAAWIALFKDDLKAILAFSTVSQLGMMTMLLGFGTAAAAIVAVFHIVNHATFKAALFMSAGAIDHEAGTRHIHRLGGLATLMPVIATLSLCRGGGDGRHPAVERVSVEGDDARGGIAHGLSRGRMAVSGAGDAGGAALGGLFAPFRDPHVSRSGAARLSAPSARSAGRAVAADRGAGPADRRDRDRAGNDRRPDRRAHRAGGGRRRACRRSSRPCGTVSPLRSR